MLTDPSFTTPEGVNALLNVNHKARFAAQVERRRALRQRLELVEIFADVRGALGHAFRGETFYGPSIHAEERGR